MVVIDPDENPVPGHKNCRVFCDESGTSTDYPGAGRAVLYS
jgi:hypothetical protein